MAAENRRTGAKKFEDFESCNFANARLRIHNNTTTMAGIKRKSTAASGADIKATSKKIKVDAPAEKRTKKHESTKPTKASKKPKKDDSDDLIDSDISDVENGFEGFSGSEDVEPETKKVKKSEKGDKKGKKESKDVNPNVEAGFGCMRFPQWPASVTSLIEYQLPTPAKHMPSRRCWQGNEDPRSPTPKLSSSSNIYGKD